MVGARQRVHIGCEKSRRAYIWVCVCSVLVACGGSVRSGLWHRLNGIGTGVCRYVARMGVACVWMARMWAVPGSVRLRSARLAAAFRTGRRCMHRVVAWA